LESRQQAGQEISVNERIEDNVSAPSRRRLRLAIPQNPRRRGRLRLELRYFCVVFRREIKQPFLREGVGVFGETAAALGLFF
jgi:hypothetical protein